MKYVLPFVKHMTKLQKIIAVVLLAMLAATITVTFFDWRPMFYELGDFHGLSSETLVSEVQAGFPEVPPTTYYIDEVTVVAKQPLVLDDTPVSLKDLESL